MADTRITGLAAITGAATDVADLFVLVDVSDLTMAATGTNKKITRAELALSLSVLTQAGADALYSPLAHTHSFASLTAKPTTIGGYGITDFNALGDARWSLLAHTHAAADITSGVLANGRIATGTPDGTKFLRDDQVWTAVSASDATKLPLAGGTMTGTITSTIGTITADKPFLDATATWNNAAVTFYGIRLNVTASASAAASRMIDIQGAGTTYFNVAATGGTFAQDMLSGTNNTGGNGAIRLAGSSSLTRAGSAHVIGWCSGNPMSDGTDTGISRNAAGVLEINNGTAGTFRDILVRSAIIDGAPSTAAAGQVAIGADTRTTIGANGAATALTANPVGYIDINVAGTAYQIPYYTRGA